MRSNGAFEIEHVLPMEYSHKLFHFIQDDRRKTLSVNDATHEADGCAIQTQ